MEFILTIHSGNQMEQAGAVVASVMPECGLLTLQGELGAGKTTFSKGFIHQRLPGAGEVTSPTFTLVQSYEAAGKVVYHCDFYRLENILELDALGMDEMIEEGTVLVEWPEIALHALPEPLICCRLVYGPNEGTRMLCLEGRESLVNAIRLRWDANNHGR